MVSSCREVVYLSFGPLIHRVVAAVSTTESAAEALVEELISLHVSSPTFRQVFRSQQTTQILVDAYKAFVTAVAATPEVHQRTIRILEKVSHFALTLALDSDVIGPQKREVYPFPWFSVNLN